MAEAFEQRKHQARRMGEKSRDKTAGTIVFASGSGHGNDHAPGMDCIWMILSRNIAVLRSSQKGKCTVSFTFSKMTQNEFSICKAEE